MDMKQTRTRKTISQSQSRGKSPLSKTAKTLTQPSVSVCDDLGARIANRAYELYAERGYGDGYALEDWIKAEREVLSQVPSV